MKSAYVIFLLLIISLNSLAQKKETDNFPPPETPIEIKATKVITNFFREEPVKGKEVLLIVLINKGV